MSRMAGSRAASLGTPSAVAGLLAAGLALSPAMAQRPPSQASVASIIGPDMLGIQVAYLESRTGPARRVTRHHGAPGQQREYRLGRCDITALVVSNEVRAYRLRLSPSCSFDIRRFSDLNIPVPAHQVTFGMLEAALPFSRFAEACWLYCGNAADPVYSLHLQGSRSQSGIEVLASVAAVGEPVLRAVEAVVASGLQAMPETDIVDGRLNCHPDYDRLAKQAFRPLVVTEIAIGYGLAPRQPECR